MCSAALETEITTVCSFQCALMPTQEMVVIKLHCFIGPFGEIVSLDLTHYIFGVQTLTIYSRSS